MENEFEISGCKLGTGPIFGPGEYSQYNACLNWTHDSLELYVMGYKEAADVLVTHVVEKRRGLDMLIYPICFLYRQYIELRLKELIISGQSLLDERAKFPTHHKLEHLWSEAKRILEEVFDGGSPDEFYEGAERVVREFAAIDPASFSFRYPIDKQGCPVLPGVRHINALRLGEAIEVFATFADSASSAIASYLEAKAEMESYYRDYYGT